MSADGSFPIGDRLGIGGNNPPEPSSFDAFDTHVSDLLTEARNHLDGAGVQTEGEAEAVSKLLDLLRTAAKDADKARTVEKKPHDDAAKAVQAKWKPLLDRCETAVQTCKSALAPYLRRQEEAKREAEAKARAEAERIRAEAEAATRAAAPTDLEARESAEALAADAKRAEAQANRAAQDRGQAKGGARATTLRTFYMPILTDVSAAVRHYWTTNPEAFDGFVTGLAKADVMAGKRTIPGFDVVAEARVV